MAPSLAQKRVDRDVDIAIRRAVVRNCGADAEAAVENRAGENRVTAALHGRDQCGVKRVGVRTGRRDISEANDVERRRRE